MKDSRLYIVLSVIAVLGAGCTGGKVVLKPSGDKASISLWNDAAFTAELLAVNDTVLFVAVESEWSELNIPEQEKVIAVPHTSLKSIKVMGYANNDWILPWVGFNVVPGIILATTAISYDSELTSSSLFGFLLPAGLTGWALFASTPAPPGVEQDLTPEKVGTLKKYMRFPQGLSRYQLNRIAKSYRQTTVRVLGRWDQIE